MLTPAATGPRATYLEGIDKVTGRAKYTFDLVFPNMLVGKFLYAEYPRARIKRLDTAGAEAIPGVEAVVTHRDVPGEKIFGYIVKDQPVFAIDEVCFIGDVVAAVAAVDEETALQALQAIEVEYEPLPGIFDPIEAMGPEAIPARSDLTSNILAHIPILHGDVERGFVEAEVVVERTYRTAPVEQLFLETEGTVADWDGETLTIYTSGQHPHRDRIQLAEIMNLPANRVRVIYPYVGGGFGGKDEIHTQAHVALLAWKTGRPVKTVRSRSESFLTHVKRHALTTRYKIGAKKDGTLTAIDVEAVLEAGPYSNASVAVAGFAAEMSSGCYKVPHARIHAFAVATNNLNGGAMRGFGGPEIAFAQEQAIDVLAEKLGMDPLELRLKNGMEKGTLMPTGAYIYYDIGLKETIRKVAEVTDWTNRDRWLERHPGPHLRRGLGVASIWHGMSIGRNLMDSGRAAVEMAPDGTVLVLSSVSEIGSGSRTAAALIAAGELGIRAEDVKVALPDTDSTPDAGPTTASRILYIVGNAILQATTIIKQSLLEVASEALEAAAEDLVLAEGKISVRGAPERFIRIAEAARKAWERNKPLRGEGHFTCWQPPEPKAQFTYPLAHSVFMFATHVAQVLVNLETGQIQVETVWAVHDVGKAINMLGIEGQIHGGILQGVGTALMEELRLEEGRLLNASLESYLVPTSTDYPVIVPVVVEVPDPTGPYGAKGLGEATFTPVAAAIANAVADATGVRMWEIPMTPERVLAALEQGDGNRVISAV